MAMHMVGPPQPAAVSRHQQSHQHQHMMMSSAPAVMPGSRVLDMPEVVAAVETLYDDELKPYGRILRKRLAERAAAAGQGSVDVDIKLLRSVCEACPWIYIQAEEGGDWSALLRSRQMAFIDVYSPQDLYPPELWVAASAYFQGLDDAKMVLPGGRYSCAQALISRGLQFLLGRTLGQVCHIVQLAISQKKILGYLNGAVVPYGRSQSMVKERCAERQKPCTSTVRSTGSGSSDLAGWAVVKNGLKEILSNLSPGTVSIPLSNVKRLFRSRFHMELSETALGHSKLSELLQDPRLQDVCFVRLQGHGYVVFPAAAQPPKQLAVPPVQPHLQAPPPQVSVPPQMSPSPQPQMSAAAAGAAVAAAAAAAALGQPAPVQASWLGPNVPNYQGGNFAPLPPPAPGQVQADLPYFGPLGSEPTPAAVETGPHTSQRPIGASLRDRARWVQPLTEVDESSQLLAHHSQSLESPGDSLRKGHVMPMTTPSPSGSLRRAKSMPRGVGTEKVTSEALMHPQTPGYLPPRTPESPGFPSWPMLTPGALGGMGFSVQNTFINCPLPPPTPFGAATFRSHSLPRNMGASEKTLDTEVREIKGDRLNGKEDLGDAPKMSPGPGNRLMSAAAAAVSGDGPAIAPRQKVHTPRSLKGRGKLAAADLASGIAATKSSGGAVTPDSCASGGSSGQRVVRLADLL
eukprot:TRINITY_DN6004_c3_g1_i1.p1 TRINITY_DN6004_c3_g1~~TRINITY_DN6004_c3_g1_i1.p1  ORF type:complete len:761 (+),score=163.65 TRINITY_DN6004_c3_g1_i1:223-2283(+)